jgi:hypothetical protein
MAEHVLILTQESEAMSPLCMLRGGGVHGTRTREKEYNQWL